MVALVFEVYGAFCFVSLLAFLVLASVAKLTSRTAAPRRTFPPPSARGFL
jgi:hypothetical protein